MSYWGHCDKKHLFQILRDSVVTLDDGVSFESQVNVILGNNLTVQFSLIENVGQDDKMGILWLPECYHDSSWLNGVVLTTPWILSNLCIQGFSHAINILHKPILKLGDYVNGHQLVI